MLILAPIDLWTPQDSMQGVQIFGATGSGKTSGSGQAIAKSLLRAGFGGLVLCAKTDERETWQRYCEETGRTDSLLIFDGSGKQRFNFLQYEQERPGAGGGQTENIVELLFTALRTGRAGSGGGSNEEFWENAARQLLRNAVDALRLAGEPLTLMALMRVIASGPQSKEMKEDPSWLSSSECLALLERADARDLSERDRHDLEVTTEFWLEAFPRMDERTRANIISTFTGMADGFMRGALHELFCTDISVVPELTHHGTVIVVDLSIKEYHKLGRTAQIIWKYLWQRATEQRCVDDTTSPTFLWADESQFFVTENDAEFQSTARSKKAISVYLTQNISNYYKNIGGQDPKAATDSLLGNFQTKIFHANGDAVTNEWAERLFAKDWKHHTGIGSSDNTGQDNQSGSTSSFNTNESLDPIVPASWFTTLRTGGHENNLLVDAIIFQGGRVWNATNSNWIKTTFSQVERPVQTRKLFRRRRPSGG